MNSLSYITLIYSTIYSKVSSNSHKVDGSLNSTQEVQSLLKFVSMIQEGEKLSIKGDIYVQPANIFTSVARTLFPECRNDSLRFLKSLIIRSFEIIQVNMTSKSKSEKNLASDVYQDIQNCIVGLKNIQVTYKDDRYYVCQIQALIQMINVKLTEFSETYPDTFKLKAKVPEGGIHTEPISIPVVEKKIEEKYNTSPQFSPSPSSAKYMTPLALKKKPTEIIEEFDDD